MIPLFRKITYPSFFSFSASLESPPEFNTPWHYHPEYELILIMNCTGTRFMGDHIAKFNDVELVLIGPNLPHFWKEEDITKNLHEKKYACVIHFSEHFLGDKIFELPESYKIKQLLDRSKLGIVFNEEKESNIIKKMHDILKGENFDRILDLLSLLHALCKSADYKKLSSEGFVNIFNQKKSKRINLAIEYAMNNFKNKIVLETVSKSVHMSKSSFCRFFKKSTGKTYFDFVREIRIGYACKLIIENDMNITQIAYECGYESISNFNRQFKATKKVVPIEYKRKMFNHSHKNVK